MAEDENSPATKKDVRELEARMDGKLSGLEARMDGKLSGLEARMDGKLSEVKDAMSDLKESITEQIRDSQTEILKAFLPWQESVHTQYRKLEANMGNNVVSIEERMGILERRLWEIEKRLLMNPPAA